MLFSSRNTFNQKCIRLKLVWNLKLFIRRSHACSVLQQLWKALVHTTFYLQQTRLIIYPAWQCVVIVIRVIFSLLVGAIRTALSLLCLVVGIFMSLRGHTKVPVKREWELKSESLHESFLNSHTLVKRELHESWEARVCMRVFSTLIPWSNESCMGVDESWEARVCMRVFWTFMPWSNEIKSCMRVDASWEARVCVRVFSTLMSRSNENKSCLRVDDSGEARVYMRVFSTLVPRSNENKSCLRVEKQKFAWEFSQLSCPGQTRTSVNCLKSLQSKYNHTCSSGYTRNTFSWDNYIASCRAVRAPQHLFKVSELTLRVVIFKCLVSVKGMELPVSGSKVY
jgi:hypothetical protein